MSKYEQAAMSMSRTAIELKKIDACSHEIYQRLENAEELLYKADKMKKKIKKLEKKLEKYEKGKDQERNDDDLER